MATEVSFEPTTVNLTVYKGDSINLKYTIKDNGSSYSIPALGGGAGWKGSIKTSSDLTYIKVMTVAGTAASDNFTVYVPNTITTTFVAGTPYKYDIQYTWVDTGVTYIRTFVKGTITVLDDVTLASDS
jgi:hypothetical protein